MVTLSRVSDATLDELHLTLRNAIRNDYVDKPLLRNHAEMALDAVMRERTNRINRRRYPHVRLDYVSNV